MAFKPSNKGLAFAAGVFSGVNKARENIRKIEQENTVLGMQKEKHDLEMKTEKAKLNFHQKYFANENDPLVLKKKEELKTYDNKVKADINFAKTAQYNALSQNKNKVKIGQQILAQAANKYAQDNGLVLSKETMTDPVTGQSRTYERPDEYTKGGLDNVIKRKILNGEPLTKQDRDYYNAFMGDAYSVKSLPGEEIEEPDMPSESGEGYSMQNIFRSIFGEDKKGAAGNTEMDNRDIIEQYKKKYPGRTEEEIIRAIKAMQ